MKDLLEECVRDSLARTYGSLRAQALGFVPSKSAEHPRSKTEDTEDVTTNLQKTVRTDEEFPPATFIKLSKKFTAIKSSDEDMFKVGESPSL